MGIQISMFPCWVFFTIVGVARPAFYLEPFKISFLFVLKYQNFTILPHDPLNELLFLAMFPQNACIACPSLCFCFSSFNYLFRIFNHLNSLFNTFMLLSHSGEYPCVCKHVIFAANSQNMKQVRTYKWLRTLANCLRILANFLRSLQYPTVAETAKMWLNLRPRCPEKITEQWV